MPKGKTKMFARKEETVDVATGQPVEIDLFDDKGKRTYHLAVKKLGVHNGVAVAEDTETETEGPVGTVRQRTVATKVEVETE